MYIGAEPMGRLIDAEAAMGALAAGTGIRISGTGWPPLVTLFDPIALPVTPGPTAKPDSDEPIIAIAEAAVVTATRSERGGRVGGRGSRSLLLPDVDDTGSRPPAYNAGAPGSAERTAILEPPPAPVVGSMASISLRKRRGRRNGRSRLFSRRREMSFS